MLEIGLCPVVSFMVGGWEVDGSLGIPFSDNPRITSYRHLHFLWVMKLLLNDATPLYSHDMFYIYFVLVKHNTT